MNKAATFVMGALAGALVGVCAAMAFTPRTGEEMRGLAMEKANSIAGSVTSAVPFLDNAPAASPATGADNEELRAKIEAARQRIAAQVAENNA